jgi:SagB-type dehydrogenase family enzyme
MRSLMLAAFVLVLVAGPFVLGAEEKSVALPPPAMDGKMSVEKAISSWKTERKFSETPLTLAQVGQLLWSANGKIETDATTGATRRAVPSAWKAYPIDVYLIVGEKTVTDLPAGIYRYDPEEHDLKRVEKEDKRTGLSQAAGGQKWLLKVPIALVICGDFERTIKEKATPEQWANWVRSEAGMVAQNVILQARALDLAGNAMGAFKEADLAKVLKLKKKVKPMLCLGLGK